MALKAPVKAGSKKPEPVEKPRTLADRKKALRSLMHKVNTKAKHTVMAFADDVVSPYFLRRPSGILQLDIDTGGGIPAGGLSMMSGPDNAGKTFVLFKYMAMHQRLYGNASFLGYAPTEGAPDYFFMRKCGMKIAIPDEMIEEREVARKIRGLPPFTKEERASFKEQIGDFCILAGHTAEDLFDCVLAAVRDDIFGIIGIDSFTMALPEALAEKDTFHKNPQMAASATLVTRFLTKFANYMLGVDGRNNTTIIGTQQVRANKAKAEALPHIQKYLPDYVPAGGFATKHGKMIDVLLMPGQKFREKSAKDGERGEILGKSIKWRLIKGKAGTHDNIEGEVEFDYENLTEDLRHVVVTGLRYGGIIEQDGKLSLIRAATGEEHPDFKKIVGVDRFIEKIGATMESELLVRYEVLAHAGVECAYR